MKPVLVDPRYWGDCFRACVASMLEVPVEECPHIPSGIEEFHKTCMAPPFASLEEYKRNPDKLFESEWWNDFCAWWTVTKPKWVKEFEKTWSDWFEERGLVCHTLAPLNVPIRGYYIAGCEWGPLSHALVMCDGRVVHDPNGYAPDAPEHPWRIVSLHVIAPRDPSVLTLILNLRLLRLSLREVPRN